MAIPVNQREPGTDAVSEVTSVEPKMASQEILHHEIVEGKDALERPTGRLFFPACRLGWRSVSACS